MPTSDNEGKAWSAAKFSSFAPQHVTDVGIGNGTYSDLLRTPDVTWAGIEAFEPYVAMFNLETKYDTLLISDARTCDFPTTDLMIFGDVLEHMTHSEARGVIARAKEASRAILVSVPLLHLDQDAVNGNEFERHIDHWSFEEMYEFLQPQDSLRGDILGVFWWQRDN